jgi:hypothetical protein
MSRGLWFLAGAGAGVYAALRGRRAAEALTADGLRDRWHAVGAGARVFREEVATGKAEAEVRLRETFGPAYDPRRQLAAGPDDPAPHGIGATAGTPPHLHQISTHDEEGPQ